MSLNPRHVTQGGQVAFMRLRMFLQINNILSFYLICGFMLISVSWVFVRMSLQNIKSGLFFWWSYAFQPLTAYVKTPALYQLEYYDRTLYYTSAQMLKDPWVTWCGQQLVRELIMGAMAGLAVVFIIALAVFWYLGRQGRNQSEDRITGGRTLSDSPKAIARLMKKRGLASDIRIDDLPMVRDSEIQNFLIHGTVGSGKSTLIRKFLVQCRARGDLVILYDRGCTFVREFYDPEKDKILNPLDQRCANWDLWEECSTLADLETAASVLIPMGTSQDPFWQGSARTIFAEAVQRMRRDPERSYTRLLHTLLTIDLDRLHKFLEGTPASTLVDGKIEKTALSIRSVLTQYVKALRYLQGTQDRSRPAFTLRHWMQDCRDDGKNGWLFVTSSPRHHESLKPVISLWLSIAASSLLSMGENRTRRVWFWYDELKSLHKLPSLPDIMAEARKYGGCFGLGFQSFPQLEELYGRAAASQMSDLLNTRFFFRSPAASVARLVQSELGEFVRMKCSEHTSFGSEQVRDGISFARQEERQPLVSFTDIQTLPDLSCYVTLPGDWPVVRMNLKYQPLPVIADEFQERPVSESLDTAIEDAIARSEKEASNLHRLFATETSEEETAAQTSSGRGSELKNIMEHQEQEHAPCSEPEINTFRHAEIPDSVRTEEMNINHCQTPEPGERFF